jgi:hypothetical protein
MTIDKVQRWIQAPDFSCGEKEKFSLFEAPDLSVASIQNPGRFLFRRRPPEPSAQKSKIQNLMTIDYSCFLEERFALKPKSVG